MCEAFGNYREQYRHTEATRLQLYLAGVNRAGILTLADSSVTLRKLPPIFFSKRMPKQSLAALSKW